MLFTYEFDIIISNHLELVVYFSILFTLPGVSGYNRVFIAHV